MPLQATSGAASYDAFGGGVPVVPAYIEEVFSCFLYTGNVTSLNITNGIDLAGKGGLIWTKERNNTATHLWIDSQRGLANGYLRSDTTDAANTSRVSESISSFNADGYTLHAPDTLWDRGSYNYVSWTFRKQPKFFDVVTYTGNATSNRQIAHNLGSVPGCIIIKRTNGTSNWKVNHRSLAANQDLSLNLTNAADSANDFWDNTRPTSTHFTVGSLTAVNGNGDDFVAYIFAHDAGGFGLTGTDNVISCGSYSGTGSPVAVTLGYEPQWIMFKSATSADNWRINDVMRGMPTGGTTVNLAADLSNAEYGSDNRADVTSTGFIANGANSQSGVTHIYIAIRRGPMKVPTSGTSVFAIDTCKTGSSGTPSFISNFPVDMGTYRDKTGSDWYLQSRLTNKYLITNSTAAESASSLGPMDYNTGWLNIGATISNLFSYMFRRAPNFFDEVCYTGTGASLTLNHNLGVTPELVISKRRSGVYDWTVYSSARGTANTLFLNLTNAETAYTSVNAATATTFTVEGVASASGETFVAYLFASLAGVQDIGSYTGNGTSVNVTTGFQPRFIMVKRTDSTGNWIVGDSARGLVAGNDPFLLLNTNAAETTNQDWVDVSGTGFTVNETGANANVSTGTYIYWAIA